MVHTLEAIRGSDGSIRVGTTGTVGALITHELDSMKSTPQAPVSCRRHPHTSTSTSTSTHTVPVSVDCGTSTRRMQARRMSSNRMRTAENASSTDRRRRGSVQKKLHSTWHSAHGIPMLSSEDICMDGNRTPRRGRTTKKGCAIVEIVDLKCGNTDKGWSRPITDQFKKLSFSRISD